MTKTPESCELHQIDNSEPVIHSFTELGYWIHTLVEHAMQSIDSVKVKEDLESAQYFLNLMQAKLNDIKENL